jgi:hypothetical protein
MNEIKLVLTVYPCSDALSAAIAENQSETGSGPSRSWVAMPAQERKVLTFTGKTPSEIICGVFILYTTDGREHRVPFCLN